MHKSVMLKAVLEYIKPAAHLNTQAKVIDATLGAGGYTIAFCKAGFDVLSIEWDREMFAVARTRIEKACPPNLQKKVGSFRLVHGNFADIKKLAAKENFKDVAAVVFDFGVATQQLTSKTRGLSFANHEADLDMRLSPATQSVMARDLLNILGKNELMAIFSPVCSYQVARDLALRVLDFRSQKRFVTVGDLLSIIPKVKPGMKTNPATKPFMALRMAVNYELTNIESGLNGAVDLLAPGGRIVAVTFHSGEDSIVKKLFYAFEKNGLGVVVTKKPVLPNDQEVMKNRRARSAKLRVFEKSNNVQKNADSGEAEDKAY